MQGVRSDLSAGVPRSVAWGQVESQLPASSPLRYLLRTHRQNLSLLEALRARKRHTPYTTLPHPVPNGPQIAPAARRRGICRACRVALADHGDPAVRLRHMFCMKQQHWARVTWAKRTPAERRAIMEKAWAGRRRAKDARILQGIHPRIRRVLGDSAVLRAVGR